MAAAYQSGSAYTDADGVLISGKVKISEVIFTNINRASTVTFHDGADSSAPIKFKLLGHTDRGTEHYSFIVPIVFGTGIYISSLTSSCSVTVVTTSGGN